MDVILTQAQEAFIRHAVESGRLTRKEDAIQEALVLWEERERRRLEILSAVDRSEALLARGGGRRVTSHEGASQLANDVVRRGTDRLAADQKTR